MSPIVIVFWIMAAGTLFLPEVVALYFFICMTPFGALNTMPEAFSSVNLLPQTVAALILAARAMMNKDMRTAQLTALVKWRGFAFLALFVVYGVFSAFVFPRIFEGRVEVFALQGVAGRTKLEPTMANINQSAYLISDLLSVTALFAYLKCDRTGEVREHLMKASMICGLLLLGTGLLEYSDVAPELVAMFRTASYDNFVTGEVVTLHRIAGFFPEASAYGPKCVVFGGLLFFGRAACRSNLWRKVWCPLVAMILIGVGALSTSSTAFCCIFLFLGLLCARIGYLIFRRRRFAEYSLDVSLLVFGALVLGLAWMAAPELLNGPINLLDSAVFKKGESSSYIERSGWNSLGKLAFWGTDGVGVGVGGARVSNWAIAVVSNTGVVGTALMGAYLYFLFYQKPTKTNPRWATLAHAGKYSMAIFMAGEVVSGTTIDPGQIFSILAATIAAGSAWSDQIGQPAARKKRPASAPGLRRRKPGEAAPQPEEPQTAFASPQA
ncbi:MAG TPA: hypothetical protein VMU59_09830 [Caulobacteraceae bacterium]|nr:hypothetical protein [Caulobacteraceae bacterium]